MITDSFTELQQRDTSGQALQSLWKAVFLLDTWHFLQTFGPNGEAPPGPPPLGNIAPMFEWHLDRLPPSLFDAFVKGVTTSNAPQAWARLKRRLVCLEQWFFLGDRERLNAPRIQAHGREVLVLVFTDAEHAARASQLGGTDQPAAGLPLIPAAPKAAVAYLKTLAARSDGTVQHTLFNVGSQPFTESIDDLDRFVAFRWGWVRCLNTASIRRAAVATHTVIVQAARYAAVWETQLRHFDNQN